MPGVLWSPVSPIYWPAWSNCPSSWPLDYAFPSLVGVWFACPSGAPLLYPQMACAICTTALYRAASSLTFSWLLKEQAYHTAHRVAEWTFSNINLPEPSPQPSPLHNSHWNSLFMNNKHPHIFSLCISAVLTRSVMSSSLWPHVL